MALTDLCFACMTPIDTPDAVCPRCGHDNQTRDNGPGLLGHTVLQGQYLVGRMLGRGGFCVTYLGYDLNLERRVAIKEFFPSHLVMRSHDNLTLSALTGSEGDYQRGCQRALKESQVAARMGQIHGVVQVYNVFSANNTVYIVMEYVEGDTLTQYIEKHPRMTVADAIEVLSPVARALSTLHQKSVIHRDVKPDNIMVHGGSQQGVLLDFGAARIADNTTISHSAAVVSQGYAPLEQYNMSSLDGRIDQYALAATLFHMLGGQRPPDVLQRVAQGNAMPSLPALNPGVSARTEAVLLKGMSIKAEDRYPDMAAFWDALKQSITAPAPKAGFSVKKVVALCAAIALAAGVLGYYVPRTALWQGLFASDTQQVASHGPEADGEQPDSGEPAPEPSGEPAPTDAPAIAGETDPGDPPPETTDIPAATEEVPAPTDEPTPIPTEVPTPEPTATSKPTPTLRPLPVPRISNTIKAFGVVNVASQPLYREADTQSEELLRITHPGEVVYVFHFVVVNQQGDEWAKVICQGQTGYVPARFILLLEAKQQDDFQYMTVGRHQALLAYTGSETRLALPETIDDLPLTTIVSGAFKGSPVRELTLPASINTIAPDAFEALGQMLLYVEAGSAAEAYAQQQGISYELIEAQPTGGSPEAASDRSLDDPAAFLGEWTVDGSAAVDLSTGERIALQSDLTMDLSFRLDGDGNLYVNSLSAGLGYPWTFEDGIFRTGLFSYQVIDGDHLAMIIQMNADSSNGLPSNVGLLCSRKASVSTGQQTLPSSDMAFYAGTWLMEMSGDASPFSLILQPGSSDATTSYLQLELRPDGTCTSTLMGIEIESTWELDGNQIEVAHVAASDVYLIVDDNTLELQSTYETTFQMPEIRLVRAEPV